MTEGVNNNNNNNNDPDHQQACNTVAVAVPYSNTAAAAAAAGTTSTNQQHHIINNDTNKKKQRSSLGSVGRKLANSKNWNVFLKKRISHHNTHNQKKNRRGIGGGGIGNNNNNNNHINDGTTSTCFATAGAASPLSTSPLQLCMLQSEQQQQEEEEEEAREPVVEEDNNTGTAIRTRVILLEGCHNRGGDNKTNKKGAGRRDDDDDDDDDIRSDAAAIVPPQSSSSSPPPPPPTAQPIASPSPVIPATFGGSDNKNHNNNSNHNDHQRLSRLKATSHALFNNKAGGVSGKGGRDDDWTDAAAVQSSSASSAVGPAVHQQGQKDIEATLSGVESVVGNSFFDHIVPPSYYEGMACWNPCECNLITDDTSIAVGSDALAGGNNGGGAESVIAESVFPRTGNNNGFGGGGGRGGGAAESVLAESVLPHQQDEPVPSKKRLGSIGLRRQNALGNATGMVKKIESALTLNPNRHDLAAFDDQPSRNRSNNNDDGVAVGVEGALFSLKGGIPGVPVVPSKRKKVWKKHKGSPKTVISAPGARDDDYSLDGDDSSDIFSFEDGDDDDYDERDDDSVYDSDYTSVALNSNHSRIPSRRTAAPRSRTRSSSTCASTVDRVDSISIDPSRLIRLYKVLKDHAIDIDEELLSKELDKGVGLEALNSEDVDNLIGFLGKKNHSSVVSNNAYDDDGYYYYDDDDDDYYDYSSTANTSIVSRGDGEGGRSVASVESSICYSLWSECSGSTASSLFTF